MARYGRSFSTLQPRISAPPRVSPPPPPPPPVTATDWVQVAAATAVPIYPADNAQTVVNANPAGTTFVIKTGTHIGFSLSLTTAHNGDRFIGEPGAILDGVGVTTFCLKGLTRDVLFRGWSVSAMMTIRNYVPASSQATVVSCTTNDDVRLGLPGWELAYLNVTDNACVSVRGGASSNIHDLTITNAGTVPLSGAGYGSPLRPCIVRDIVITNFNTSNSIPGNEGGVKFAVCRYVDVSHVTIIGNPNHAAAHDSYGLWFDGDCEHIVVRDCTISDLPRAGLQAEVAGTMQFYNNTITNCGFAFDGIGVGPYIPPSPTWGYGYGAGINIASSGHGPLGDGLDIYDNTITNCNEGIVIVEQPRGLWATNGLTHHFSQDVRVLRNTLNSCGGSGVLADTTAWSATTTYGAGTGISRDTAGQVYYNQRLFMSKQNANLNHVPPNSASSDSWWEYVAGWPFDLAGRRLQWNLNTYTGSCGSIAQPSSLAPFYWGGSGQSFATWQATGQDINGSYS